MRKHWQVEEEEKILGASKLTHTNTQTYACTYLEHWEQAWVREKSSWNDIYIYIHVDGGRNIACVCVCERESARVHSPLSYLGYLCLIKLNQINGKAYFMRTLCHVTQILSIRFSQSKEPEPKIRRSRSKRRRRRRRMKREKLIEGKKESQAQRKTFVMRRKLRKVLFAVFISLFFIFFTYYIRM